MKFVPDRSGDRARHGLHRVAPRCSALEAGGEQVDRHGKIRDKARSSASLVGVAEPTQHAGDDEGHHETRECAEQAAQQNRTCDA
ncbi:hypothetical protein Arub01_27640 [Actinomadura rubrobrunea]|uniref:Uncharacterized protein n=1 Tax=Actinomadura rubrobrunea TaxID=115335 RepID=A0A9W6UXB4_9ACTN|nr:hypothetical protein Arub01_27640 [Actinomadura rubrobrunea]